MGLTTAMFTSLSGMNASSLAIDVSGNNIANVNTTGFKASRASFETQMSQTVLAAAAPSESTGGRNPAEVGLGTRLASISRSFEDGSVQPTGVASELAVEGNGFFILDLEGQSRYTRAGNFTLDRDFNLVNPDGGRVQGFGVNADSQIVEGVLGPIVIPIGSQTVVEPTRTIKFKGNLNAGGDAATAGTLITAAPIYADAAATVPAGPADDLERLFDAQGRTLFQVGDVITVTGARKGGDTRPDRRFEVGPDSASGSDAAGTTLQSYLDFLREVLGIDTAVGGGVSVSAAGEITVEGNSGTANDLDLDSANIVVNQSTDPSIPFTLTKQREADGESVRTTFVAYDSLGTAMAIDLGLVLEAKGNTGTSWRFYLESDDDSDLDPVLGSGTLSFDTNGQLVTVADNAFRIDRDGTGAFTPQSLTAVFDEPQGAVTALAEQEGQIAAISQDGSPAGTLANFSIGRDGTVVGVFSNSLQRPLGRVALALFANPQGLKEMGGNLFGVSVNSGLAAAVSPGSAGSGQILGGALELANVDLSQEFINLIAASTGFTANSRVLTTSDRLIQDLLAVLR